MPRRSAVFDLGDRVRSRSKNTNEKDSWASQQVAGSRALTIDIEVIDVSPLGAGQITSGSPYRGRGANAD